MFIVSIKPEAGASIEIIFQLIVFIGTLMLVRISLTLVLSKAWDADVVQPNKWRMTSGSEHC